MPTYYSGKPCKNIAQWEKKISDKNRNSKYLRVQTKWTSACIHSILCWHLLSVSCQNGLDIIKHADKSQFNGTSVEVTHNSIFVFVIFTTWSTTKLLVSWVFLLMTVQSSCCNETHWTFTAHIRLHTFMTNYMFLKVTTLAEFILTNVTCKPSSFIVWLQQMCLELVVICKMVLTVSTWVRLCTSVSINMILQTLATFKPLPTVTTVIRCPVAVGMMFMFLQVAGLAETSVTLWTLVWFVSTVDSHVTVKTAIHTECLVTLKTFVWLLSTVTSAVKNKLERCHKPFATNSTFKWFLSRMSLPVPC